MVAFENAFERTFGLIESEGGISTGGVIVQDCLSFLANLLHMNASNQSLFRETGCVSRLYKLLIDSVEAEQTGEGIPEWARPQRVKNLWGLLAIVRLFLVPGGVGTQANQAAFWKSGLVVQLMRLAFNDQSDVDIRAEVCLRR